MKVHDIIPVLKTWDDIYSAYKHFSHCDNGSLSEGFTGTVVHIMATQWDTLPRLTNITHKDHKFQFFILHHIDASASMKELSQISEHAKLRCPKGESKLCQDIQKNANTAIKEINEAIKAE